MILEDHYPCELCYKYRANEPREYGVKFIDGIWACAFCRGTYLHNLAVGKGVTHATRS
jgi:hypothetical protein